MIDEITVNKELYSEFVNPIAERDFLAVITLQLESIANTLIRIEKQLTVENKNADVKKVVTKDKKTSTAKGANKRK